MKIPKSFKIFASTVNIIWDNTYCNNKERYGEASYGELVIRLSTTQNLTPLSKDRMIDCFYHEKVHTILDAIGESDLSSNEKFVDVFAKALRQTDETAIYGTE